jgi:hypothetical protein
MLSRERRLFFKGIRGLHDMEVLQYLSFSRTYSFQVNDSFGLVSRKIETADH